MIALSGWKRGTGGGGFGVRVRRPARQGDRRGAMAAILAEVSRAAGVLKARLSVNETQAAAMALYRRFGFPRSPGRSVA